MFLHVKDDDSQDYEVVNLDTNKKIKGVQWADDDLGKYCIFKTDKEGEMIYCNYCKDFQTITIKCNIKLTKKEKT